MARVFNPGHRPNQPLYPDELVYTTVEKVAEFLQLPLPDPVALAGDSSISSGTISFPVKAVEYRRWGYEKDDVVLVYDDDDALGKEYTLTGVSSGSSGQVNLEADAVASESYTTASKAYVQIQSAITESKERGLTKSHVKQLIKQRQDQIDKMCRMAWRPRLVVDEYKNFTTFKPYRRRYYTDYVGAVYLNNRSVRQILRMGVWQGDYYRELATSRIKMKVTKSHDLTATAKIFLCPGANGVATLQRGTTSTTWDGTFGEKSIAQNIANLVNKDADENVGQIQIGSLTEGRDSSGAAQPLYVHQEFLATANSDEGDGAVVFSSMRSIDEGSKTTIATTNNDVFVFSLGTGLSATVESKSGSNFTVDEA